MNWSDYNSQIIPLLLDLDNSKIARKLYPDCTETELQIMVELILDWDLKS